MLKLFKSTHPVVFGFLLFYAVILKATYFINPLPFNFSTHAPFSNLFYRIIFSIFGNNPYWENVLTIILVFIQAVLLNQLSNHYKFNLKTSFLIALSYILVTSLFWEFALLSPPLIANTFLIFIVKILFSTYKKEKIPKELFDLGFMLGISTLFYFPMFFFLLLIFIALLILRPFNLKEWMTVIIGIVVPYFLLGTYYFWKDELKFFIQNQFVKPFEFYNYNLDFNITLMVEVSLILLVSLWGFYLIQTYFNKSVVQWRKSMSVFFWFVLIGFFSFFLNPNLSLAHFILLSIPVSVFISFLFSEIRKNWLSEAIHLILLLTILFFQYNTFFFKN